MFLISVLWDVDATIPSTLTLCLQLELLSGKVLPGGAHGLPPAQSTAMFAQFLQITRLLPQLENKALDDLLIMPVQRVPRYKLLLAELCEKTPPTHPDAKDLQQAHTLPSHSLDPFLLNIFTHTSSSGPPAFIFSLFLLVLTCSC